MFTLNLPKFTPKLIEKNGKRLIWDPVRQKFVAFTPEEWVRQNFVHFLLTCRDYPQALLNNEVLIKLNGTTPLFTIVSWNRFSLWNTKPLTFPSQTTSSPKLPATTWFCMSNTSSSAMAFNTIAAKWIMNAKPIIFWKTSRHTTNCCYNR